MLILIIIAFATLDPMVKLAGNQDLSRFLPQEALYISRTIEEEVYTYYIPITSVRETLGEFIKGFYTLYNVSASSESAANFVLATAESALKIAIFIIDMLLIVTLGNIFSFLMWFLVGKHLVPKVLRKKAKLRFVGMAETAATFIVVLFLFFTPFTSILNSINQSYQRNRPDSDDPMIQNVGGFVDAYNKSLFANVLFNWTVDDSGMTLDTRLFNQFTTGVSGDVTIGLMQEIANFTNLGMIFTKGISGVSDNEFSYNPANLITKEVVNSAFDVLVKSNLLTNILPLAADIALNSNILDGFIPNRLVDLSDVEWKNELGYVQDMINCLFDSGAIDNLTVYDEHGNKVFRSFEGNDLVSFIESVVYDEKFDTILDIFRSIDKSKILSRVVPAVTKVFLDMDQEGQVKQYIPLSWEQLNEVSWGYETYVLFDFLHATISLDPQFLRSIFVQTGLYTPAEGEEIKSLPKLISEHVDEFVTLLVGETDSTTGAPINVDKYGHSIAFKDGERIAGKHYCLFDMGLIEMLLPNFLDGLFEMEGLKETIKDLSEDDIAPFHEAVKALSNGNVIINYKKEFKSILNVVATLGQDEELLDALFTGKGLEPLMKEEGNFFSIEKKHVDYFQSAIGKMDNSSVLYSALTPFIKSFMSSEDMSNMLKDFGVRNDVIVSAITHDMQKTSNHTFFKDLSNLLDAWDDLGVLMTLGDAGDTDALMEKLKDEKVTNSLVNVLDILVDNELINPTPQAGDTYAKNENLYGLLGFVFEMTADFGLNVSRQTLEEVTTKHTWHDEFVAVADILHYIAERDVLNAASLFEGGLTQEAIDNLRLDGEGHVYVPGLFAKVDDSYIFSTCLGPFVDDLFGDALAGFVVDQDINVSFTNITSWAEEGQRIANLLESVTAFIPESGSFNDFKLSSIHEIVDLNKMLHELANSGIFYYTDENDITHYQFGAWLYDKIDENMGEFTVDENSYDLLADPTTNIRPWNSSWGVRPEDSGDVDPYFQEWHDKFNPENTATHTHYISYRDFVNVNGMDNTNPNLPSFWCKYDTFINKHDAFLNEHESDLTNPATYLNNDWEAYFASQDFIDDYNDVFGVDEISRVVRFITYSMRILEPKADNTKVPFNKLETSLLDGFLTSINETHCLRISIYNFYDIATNNIFNGYEAFSLETAYTSYMVDADYPMFDFTNARPARQQELDRLTSFYDFINVANDSNLITPSGNINYEKLKDESFMNEMGAALKTLNNSLIFHRKGSLISGQQTVFQGLFNHMLADSDMKDVIYSNNSPKDNAATNYTNSATKVTYLVNNVFLTDDDAIDKGLNPDSQIVIENKEIDNLLDAIKNLYSLKNSGGETVSSLNDVDMNNVENIETMENLLKALNKSELLYDCVPNAIYKLFASDDSISISSNGIKVDFKRVDPYYHYYYDGNTKRSSIDFTARYLNEDITSISELMQDYQNFNDVLAGGDISDPAVLNTLTNETDGLLKPLLVTLHNSHLFHTPARNYTGTYYTDKFEDDGFTLFEEMISKVCSFVKLDDFAYDSAYDTSFANGAEKLRFNIKQITKSDDFATGSNYYHNGLNTAWVGNDQEVDSIIKIARTACDMTTGSTLDLSAFEFDKLDPTQIKNLLTAVNGSDLICDAVPSFIDSGFNSIGLSSLTTYNTVDYAYYRLNQAGYGGSDALAGEGTEIDEIYRVMNSLRDGDNYISNLSTMSLNDFLTSQGNEKFAGLIRYVYKSHILNTSQSGTYAEFNNVDGYDISAQGILLNQLLGSDLKDYIAKDADASTSATSSIVKIATLSKIINMNAYGENSYQVEATALNRLITSTDGVIDSSTFSSGDINDIRNNSALKAAILDVIEASYNAGGDNKRSYITSEFVSGVLNTILENEYTKLDNASNYPGYTYILYSFGDDNPLTLSADSYDDLNVTEYNGFDGMIGLLDYVNHLTTLSTSDRDGLKACFSKMGLTPGNNSKVAQALYLAEGHDKFKLLGLVPNSHMEYFIPADETSTSSSNDNSVYGSNFCFKDYGQRVDDYLAYVL